MLRKTVEMPQFRKPVDSRRTERAALLLALTLFCQVATAEVFYIVKRDDTVSSIARRYGITVSELIDRNGLASSGQIYKGQRLIVPISTPSPVGPLSSSVQRALQKANVRRDRWRYVVVHHSGVNAGSAQGMDRYHRQERHMENGLAYHFVIGNGNGMGDGEIAVGRRWTEQLAGGHLASESQNQIALGICLVGNFDKDRPTAKQMQSLNALVDALLARCNISPSAVTVHQQINIVGTRCPGRLFPTRSFLQQVKARNQQVTRR